MKTCINKFLYIWFQEKKDKKHPDFGLPEYSYGIWNVWVIWPNLQLVSLTSCIASHSSKCTAAAGNSQHLTDWNQAYVAPAALGAQPRNHHSLPHWVQHPGAGWVNVCVWSSHVILPTTFTIPGVSGCLPGRSPGWIMALRGLGCPFLL